MTSFIVLEYKTFAPMQYHYWQKLRCTKIISSGRRYYLAPSLPNYTETLRDSTAAAESPPQLSGLTQRETDVLSRLAEGRTNQEIAADLFISEHTVANHLQRIYRKIGCGNRTEASTYAIDRGLVI